MKSWKYIELVLLIILLGVTTVAAQTPSPSSIRDAVKDQVAKELADIKQAVSKKAFVGSISAKQDLTLTITNLKNQSRTATVTADTTIKLLGGKDGTPNDLKVGDFVIAMGDVDSSGILATKRLLVIAQPAADKRDSAFLTVTKATSSSLSGENLQKETWTIKVSSATKFTGETKLSDIKVGTKIIAAGTVAADKTLSAGFIHLVAAK